MALHSLGPVLAVHHRADRVRSRVVDRIRMEVAEHIHRRSSLAVRSHRAVVAVDLAVLKNRTKWVQWVAAAAAVVLVDCLVVLLKR